MAVVDSLARGLVAQAVVLLEDVDEFLDRGRRIASVPAQSLTGPWVLG
jgi:hypothetical protein